MGTVIFILIIAALVGGVFWNHYNANQAREGVSFLVAQPPSVVADTVQRLFNVGTMASLKGSVSGISVTSLGPGAFGFNSRLGDAGEISISADPAGSLVSARCLTLYVGSHPKSHNMRGSAITHSVYSMLGITPNAAKMKRWQSRLEARVSKAIARSSR